MAGMWLPFAALGAAVAAKVTGAGEEGWVGAGNGPEEELLAWWPTGAERAGAATGLLERENHVGERESYLQWAVAGCGGHRSW